jgi:hypothetical protein
LQTVVILLGLVIGTIGFTVIGAVPVTAQETPTPAFVVAVEPDGSATVTVTYTFDLRSDAEAEAFQSLQDDQAAREAFRTRFGDRLRLVAQAASDRTGRPMSVTDPKIAIDTATDGETGVARLRATWTGLARVEDDRLVISEPFASEFTPDRRFVLLAPEGYELSTGTPEPAVRERGQIEWSSGATLDGFEVVMVSADPEATTASADSTTQTTGQPGFGSILAVLAIGVLVTGLVAGRRLV